MNRLLFKDSWVPMFCPACQADIDVPRSEYEEFAGKLLCHECHSLLEDATHDLVTIWDEDLAEERKHDYYEEPEYHRQFDD